MNDAERQKRYRDKKRNAQGVAVLTEDSKRVTGAVQSVTRVTVESERNAPESTPEVAPQSTNSGQVVVEHPGRSRLVPIPGDADYVGCCHKVDGEWQVDNTKPDIKAMSTDELVRRLHYIKDWQRSPEHQEVLRRRVA